MKIGVKIEIGKMTYVKQAAKAFDFDKAAQYRDRMRALKASVVHEEANASGPGGGG